MKNKKINIYKYSYMLILSTFLYMYFSPLFNSMKYFLKNAFCVYVLGSITLSIVNIEILVYIVD